VTDFSFDSRGSHGRRRVFASVVVAGALVIGGQLVRSASADTAADENKAAPATAETPDKPAETKPAAPPKDNPDTAKRVLADADAALEFARAHHPELADLIARLKQSNRAEFRRAVRDVNMARVRLERVKEKTPNRYGMALEEWKLDSQIRLLAARSAMSDEDPAVQEELKALLHQRIEKRLKNLTDERDRLAARLAKLNEQIAKQDGDVDAKVAAELEQLRNSVTKAGGRKPAKKSKTPAETTSTTQDAASSPPSDKKPQ
jgi:hypothetical protein